MGSWSTQSPTDHKRVIDHVVIKNRILHDFQFEHYWITFSAHNMPKLEGLGIYSHAISQFYSCTVISK